MNFNARRLYNLKEEKRILERSLNLYYFDKAKRAMLFDRLERVKIEIERVENNGNIENRNTNRTQNQKKPSANGNG